MDYYNFNSDFAAFLSPAAQKNNRLSNRVLSPAYNCAENEQYARNRFSFNQDYQRPSSTSLVLKKTQDKEILEQYRNENIRYRPYTKLSKPNQNQKHRPLIRVTVIPNYNTSTQTKLRKRRPSTKKIQSTVSNHESFFKAKNILLVVGGNKREKIYEIKTTGSEYSNGNRYVKDQDIPVEQNFQQLLSSLNMDKKKKKDKGKGKNLKDKKKEKESKMDEKASLSSLVNNTEGFDATKEAFLRECICPPPMETVSPRKSRVRITGKIGLTEDDRYVLRCAATVDGKPVETNFFQEQNRSYQPERDAQETREIPRVCISSPRDRVMYCQREKIAQTELPKISQRDEIIQTNIQNEGFHRAMYPCPAFMNTCPAFRDVETQYSPQNMNAVCFSNIEKLKIFSRKDEVVQCNCPPDLFINSKHGIEADYDKSGNTPKSCNSPLVIISVYPKQEPDEKFDDESNYTKEVDSPPPLKEKVSGNKKAERNGKKKQGKGSRAGSPTPIKGKGKEKKEVDNPKGKDKGKEKADKEKPAKGKIKGVQKEKPVKEEKNNQSKSPERRQSATQFGISVGRCAECCMGCVGSRAGQDNWQGAQFNTKRMMNWVSAKNDVSDVAINIDGENEFYDVLFRQGDITTDLQVRKTLKDTQDPKNGLKFKGSLENFFVVPEDMGNFRKRSISQTFDPPNADNTETLDQTIPRLNVRDSIEISHRREEKISCNRMTFASTTSSSSSATSYNKLAPFKHFKGDSCELANPVERDKEIRELLGIEKYKPSPTRTYEEFTAKAEVDCECSLHCFYRRQRKTNISTFRNIQELRRLCMDDGVTQASDDDGVDYIDDMLEDDEECESIGYEECKDSKLLIAHNQEYSPTYGCALEDKCKNKKQLCDKLSVLKTSSSNTEQNRQTEYYLPGKSNVPPRGSKIPRPMHSTDTRKLCRPKHPSREPCGVIVQCPYSHSYETKENYQPAVRGSRPSQFEQPNTYTEPAVRGSRPSQLEQPNAYTEPAFRDSRPSQFEQPNTYTEPAVRGSRPSQFEQPNAYTEPAVRGSRPSQFKQPNTYTEPEVRGSRPSQFEQPNIYTDTSKKICSSKQPGRDPCGDIIKCPYKYENKDNNYRRSSEFVQEAYEEPNIIRNQSQPCDKLCALEDETFEEKRRSTLQASPVEQNPPLYQQLILNRNINIYLEIEQFKKQKPIILSRKQYEKVKRTIECATGKKNNCICKGQSSSRVSGDIKKTNEKKTEFTNKRVQCECEETTKDKKRRFTWGKSKSKAKKSKDNSLDEPNAQVGTCCTSNKDIYTIPSRTSVVKEFDRSRQTKISNQFADGSKTCECKLSKKRMSNAEKRLSCDVEEYDFTCCNNPDTANLIEDDSDIYNGETRKSRKTKTLLDREDYDDNQYRKTRHSKTDYDDVRKGSKKARMSELDKENFRSYDENQRKQSRKTRYLKKINDEERNNREFRKISTPADGSGDETLEQDENINQHRRSKRRESEALKNPNLQAICCHPVVMTPNNDGAVLPKKDSTIFEFLPPPEPRIADATQMQHSCKRCGRLNKGCVHTCYCSEVREEKPEPSVKQIFMNKLVQSKRHPASSTEVRYTSVIYANYKHVTFSSTNVPNENVVPSATNLLAKNYNSNSLHTIFKGRRRTPTPNLGTSAYSLYSDYSDATSIAKQAAPQALQERKPFLKRLMSCLVMRSKTSNLKIDNGKKVPEKMSVNSSVDSYHINTSLGAIELSSSIYDTSASFYSNHSVMPISSKIIKRGFLSSVRGFLTNNRKT